MLPLGVINVTSDGDAGEGLRFYTGFSRRAFFSFWNGILLLSIWVKIGDVQVWSDVARLFD